MREPHIAALACPEAVSVRSAVGNQLAHGVEALHSAAEKALDDVGHPGVAKQIDALAMVRFIADADAGMSALFPRNPGADVARQLGISDPAIYQGTVGGNTPQYLVNRMADKLADGEHRAVLVMGAELLATMFSALGEGVEGFLLQAHEAIQITDLK